MSFIEEMKKSIEEDVVITHLFLLNYDPHKKIIHAFFEGKTDESFYGTSIRKMKPTELSLKTYICGNKDSVYYHFEKLSSKYTTNQPLLFFVDKDIDDIIPQSRQEDERIYVTDYYSVENYIVTSESIEQVWAEIFRQSSGTPASKELRKTFSMALNFAHEVLLDIMSWVLLHRREGNKPNLDCIKTNYFFSINDNLELETVLTRDETIDLLDEQTRIDTTDELRSKFDNCKKELNIFNPKEIVRGHNEMDFFISFIRKLKEVVKNESGNKIKPRVEITKTNIIDIMGPRIIPPTGLKDFLNYHLQVA